MIWRRFSTTVTCFPQQTSWEMPSNRFWNVRHAVAESGSTRHGRKITPVSIISSSNCSILIALKTTKPKWTPFHSTKPWFWTSFIISIRLFIPNSSRPANRHGSTQESKTRTPCGLEVSNRFLTYQTPTWCRLFQTWRFQNDRGDELRDSLESGLSRRHGRESSRAVQEAFDTRRRIQ